jgi:uncharacterized membrane protein YccF (DUF307 family)
MKLIGNLIWLLFGGFFVFLEYLFSSIILMLTIIGIPFGLQTLKLAVVALWPFDKEIIVKPQFNGILYTIMNLIWFFVGGIWICLTHIFWGVILCITIIGIPFGRQHFKLASLAIMPFGKEVV